MLTRSTKAAGGTKTGGRAEISPRLDPDLLRPLFEQKLAALFRQLRSRLTLTAPVRFNGLRDFTAIQTFGDAIEFLEGHATALAQLESEVLSSTMEDLRVVPSARVEQIVASWPWSLRPRSLRWSDMDAVDPSELLPSAVMAELIHSEGLQDATAPTDVSRDEVLDFVRERCPGRAMGYSDPVSVTYADSSSRISGVGQALSTILLLPTAESNRAFTVDGLQIMCLYASAFSAEERAVERAARQGRQVLRMLASVANGDAHRHLLTTIVPSALKLAKAQDVLASEERVRDDLAGAVRRHIRDFLAEHGSSFNLPSNVPTDWDWASTAHELDERFASYVETLSEAGEKWARAIRANDPPRINAELWRLWRHELEGERYLVGLAQIVWPSTQRELNAKPFTSSGVRIGSDDYNKLAKVVAPYAWAFGGSAMRETNVDGDRYAPEPAVACKLLPRTCVLLSEVSPGHERKPHQTVLALEDHSDPLPVAVAGATQYAISPIAAKIAVLALGADDIKRGHLRSFELAKLARLIAPDAKRIRPREIQNCAEALDELRRLFVFLPDGGKIQLFDIKSAQDPATVSGDFQAIIGLTRLFLNTLATAGQLTGPHLRGGEYNGEFLINMSGAMRIPTKRPSLLRHYVRAAAAWNAAFKPGSGGAFDPNMLAAHTDEQWGAITNALPLAVVEYLRSNSPHRRNPTRRVQWNKERKAMREDLDDLAGMGLVVVQPVGTDGRFKLLPPPAYEEAWRQARKAGARPEP